MIYSSVVVAAQLLSCSCVTACLERPLLTERAVAVCARPAHIAALLQCLAILEQHLNSFDSVPE